MFFTILFSIVYLISHLKDITLIITESYVRACFAGKIVKKC